MTQFFPTPRPRKPVLALPSTPKRKTKRRSRTESRARFLAPLPDPSEAECDSQRALFEKHNAAAVTIRLPMPPSVNGYRTVVRNRLMTTGEGQEYHAAVAKIWRDHWNGRPPESLTGRIRVCVVAHFGRNGVADLDGRWKALLDAMTEAGVWVDDGQIDDQRMLRGSVVPPFGFVDVTVETMSEK